MQTILSTLINIINTRGLNDKKDILRTLKGNEEAEFALNLAFNPFLVTGIAKKKLSKQLGPSDFAVNTGRRSLLAKPIVSAPEVLHIDSTFKSLTSYFHLYKTGSDNDIRNVQGFIKDCISSYGLNVEETMVLESIITKSLTLGIAVKSINEVMGNIIPTFDCMLGVKLEDCEKELIGKVVTVTEKLDGNRCICVVATEVGASEPTIQFYSRNGKAIEGLEEVKKCMSVLPEGVYDGELLASDFNATQSTLRTKGEKENLVFNIFDYVSNVKEFFDGTIKEVGEPYSVRRNELNAIFDKLGIDRYVGTAVKLVPVLETLVYDKERIMAHHDFIKSRGGEGVMLNVASSKYIKDRTKNLVKVKAMKVCDLACIAIEQGEGRLSNTLGYIICNYKGYEVRVGSGFDDASREYYYKNPEEIINHIVSIQYFEETTNDNGTVSLRFPVFLAVRDDKDEESYN